MNIYFLCAGVVGALFLYLMIKNTHDRFASMIMIAGSIMILIFILQKISPLLDFAEKLAEYAKVQENAFQPVLKGLAVCYLGDLTADLCKDFGVAGWGEKIELACRFALLLIALPLFEEFLMLLLGMLK